MTIAQRLKEFFTFAPDPAELALDKLFADLQRQNRQREMDAEHKERLELIRQDQLANPSTMTPDHPDYMRMVTHSMD